MLHIPAAKMKEADMRSRSERGNRKMDEVQGWRSKRVNYEKEEGAVCRDQRGDGAQGKKEQPKCSQVRDAAGVREAEKNQNLSGNDKIVNLCPLYLFDYGTSVTSSIRTTEHGPAIDRDRRNRLCQSCKLLVCVEK